MTTSFDEDMREFDEAERLEMSMDPDADEDEDGETASESDRFASQVADQTDKDMINGVMNDCPAAAAKFMKFMPVNTPANQGSTRPRGRPPGTGTGGRGSRGGGRGGRGGGRGSRGGRGGGRSGRGGGPSASSSSSSKISSNVDDVVQDAAQGLENNNKRKYTDDEEDPAQGTDTEVDRPTSKQKAKKKAVDSDDEDNQDAPKVITLTAYIRVTSNVQMKKRSDIPSVQKGPFHGSNSKSARATS